MQLKRWVTELVDLGALQSGAYRLHPGPVRLQELIQQCLEAASSRAKTRRITLESGFAPGAPRTIQSDEQRLRQLLTILLERAVGASAAGACISVLAQWAAPHASEATPSKHGSVLIGSWMEIHITDSGPGLTQRDRDQVLASLARAQPEQRSEDSSLSLALAARLCLVLGGLLLVESDGVCGSTFIVRLPLGLPADPVIDEAPKLGPAVPSGA
jgi:signal transduction histidine kinase